MIIDRFSSQKHIKFLERHLSILPSTHQGQDVNRLAVIFYALQGLATMGIDVDVKYHNKVNWLSSLYKKFEVENCETVSFFSGFSGSSATAMKNVSSLSLPNTLFALLNLILLKDNTFFKGVLDRHSLINFVRKCQVSEGSFVASLDYTGHYPSKVESGDLRFCYIAVAILNILGCRTTEDYAEHINVELLVDYIKRCSCIQGGFGYNGEPHAGFTSCALSAISLLGCIDQLEPSSVDRTLSWVLHRQVTNTIENTNGSDRNPCFDEEDYGGFQGRENKFADTCYVYWCLNSINTLNFSLCDLTCVYSNAEKYLIDKTQNTLIGGFSKTNEDDPDVYHTSLGIAALSLMHSEFNGLLCIPKAYNIDEITKT